MNYLIRALENKDQKGVEEIFDLYWSGDFRKHLSERLQGFLDSAPDTLDQGFKWFVAVEGAEVVGVAALRKAPERMRQYAKTDKVVEFYVVAAKYKGKGIGTALRDKRIEESKRLGYSEAVFFGGTTHQDSWSFHDHSEFKRAGESIAPDGEEGQMWLMELK